LSNNIPKRLIHDAVRFHGHLGPFLILGLKAGLFANMLLGKDYFRARAIVETEPVPPCSCFIDGIQIATGCTMGKANIELKKGSSLSVTFLKDGKRLELILKAEVLKTLKGVSSKEDAEQKALNLSERPIQEFFNINKWV